jgi:hypothetical protein
MTLLGVTSATAQYRITNGTIAGGGGVVSNDCYSLSSTIGEPVAGSVRAVNTNSYGLTAGFQATTSGGNSADTLFKNGFDNPPKDCTP